MLTPVVLFVYKRLDTLHLTIQALKKNNLANLTDLFIFSDAAKNSDDIIVITQIRDYLKTITGFKKIEIIESPINKGLARSIIEGVTEIFKIYDTVIVLEDDLITTTNFLDYMNNSLNYYKRFKSVFSISGYNYDFDVPKNYPYSNYFVTRGCSWGWATWKDRWVNIDWDIQNYSEIRNDNFKKDFNISGSDLYSMLLKQKDGKLDSWAIRWYYNQYIFNGITSYPIKSLINNVGFGKDATHTKVYNRYKTSLIDESEVNFNFASEPIVNVSYQKLIQEKFSLFQRAIFGKGFTILKKIFNRS